MTAVFGRQTSTDYAVIYADHADGRQFWYRPKHVDVILGDTLGDFGVTYWGIGKPFLSRDSSTGQIKSLVGAVLAGRARIDVTGPQRTAMISEIQRAFGVRQPRIAPMRLTDLRVQPVIATQTLQLGSDADIIFPEFIDLGSDFNYTIGTGKGLFAVFAATKGLDTTITTNPDFGVNIYGKTEFVGDPWKCHVTCDLAKVWSETRRRYGGAVRYGWIKVASADFVSHIQSMERESTIKVEFTEGSMDTSKYGMQIFEMGKQIFTAINATANAGDGYFKFLPAGPETQSLTHNPLLYGFGYLGWSCSINGSYTHNRFTQEIRYGNTLSYTGRFKSDVALGMTLAVRCGSSTSRYFNDLAEPEEPCVNGAKVNRMNDRLQRELQNRRRNELLNQIFLMFITGQITEERWLAGQKYLWETSFEEDAAILSGSSLHSKAGRILKLGEEIYVQSGIPDPFMGMRGCECKAGFDPSIGDVVWKGEGDQKARLPAEGKESDSMTTGEDGVESDASNRE